MCWAGACVVGSMCEVGGWERDAPAPPAAATDAKGVSAANAPGGDTRATMRNATGTKAPQDLAREVLDTR